MPRHHPLGYCTNVHAGNRLAEVLEGLAAHAVEVRRRLDVDVLGLGLWLSSAAAGELATPVERAELRGALADLGLRVYTLNGFPYGDFHGDVVKHDVYVPAWDDARRLEYTCHLARVLADLLPDGASGSISTLPLGWNGHGVDVRRAAAALMALARALHEIELGTGRRIHVDLEPEPGCLLQRSEDVVRFFEGDLLSGDLLRTEGGDETLIRRFIGVCHDACHAAVMFESQREALDRYRRAGIAVGKAQLSSAVRVDLATLDEANRAAALEQLAAFAEDRYLHQTMVRTGDETRFFDDLPAALDAGIDGGEWRVHFHVPVDVASFGLLQTTQEELIECIGLLRDGETQLEVETYAWGVLPEPLRPSTLAAGIAGEIDWVAGRLEAGA